MNVAKVKLVTVRGISENVKCLKRVLWGKENILVFRHREKKYKTRTKPTYYELWKTKQKKTVEKTQNEWKEEKKKKGKARRYNRFYSTLYFIHNSCLPFSCSEFFILSVSRLFIQIFFTLSKASMGKMSLPIILLP